MAIVAKYGVWSNASFPWTDQTSNGLWGSIRAEVDAWITAISGNASIIANGQLPVKVKDETSSTNSGTTNGFVYEFPDTVIGTGKTGPTYPNLMFYGTQTSLTGAITDEYTNDTSNNGYGSYNQQPGHYTAIAGGGGTGYDNQAVIVYGDVDEEEFLGVAIKIGTGGSDENSFAVFKDQSNHWCFQVRGSGFAYDNQLDFWTGVVGPYDTDPIIQGGNVTSVGGGFLGNANIPGAASKPGYNGVGQRAWFPKSNKVMAGRSTSARWGDFRNLGNGEQYLSLGYNSFGFLIPV